MLRSMDVFSDITIEDNQPPWYINYTRPYFEHKSFWTHQTKHAAQENNVFGLVIVELKDKKKSLD